MSAADMNGRWKTAAPSDAAWCELPDIRRRPVVVLRRDVAIPRLGRLSDERMREVCNALSVAADCR